MRSQVNDTNKNVTEHGEPNPDTLYSPINRFRYRVKPRQILHMAGLICLHDLCISVAMSNGRNEKMSQDDCQCAIPVLLAQANL